MKRTEYNGLKRHLETITAIAEGLWNGFVVSGVLLVSAFLMNRFWIF